MRLQRARWWLSGAVVLLTGCATGTLQHERFDTDPTVAGLSAQVLLSEVPFFAQEAYQCGPASLAMMMRHQGRPVHPDELVDQVFIEARRGSLQAEMLAATRRQDLLPYVHDNRFSTLLEEVDAGNPVLVFQNLGFGFYPVWHYAVVIGYDLNDRQVVLHSGTTERLERSFRRFELEWQGGDYWAMTMHRPGTFPISAEPIPYLDASAGLEEAGRYEAAALAYQAATERWPDQLIAWLGLGNVRYRQQQYEQAQLAYQQAIRLDAGSAAAHHNLAWALMRQQDYQAAYEPARIANRLADEQGERYRSAWQAWHESQD